MGGDAKLEKRNIDQVPIFINNTLLRVCSSQMQL